MSDTLLEAIQEARAKKRALDLSTERVNSRTARLASAYQALWRAEAEIWFETEFYDEYVNWLLTPETEYLKYLGLSSEDLVTHKARVCRENGLAVQEDVAEPETGLRYYRIKLVKPVAIAGLF